LTGVNDVDHLQQYDALVIQVECASVMINRNV
jgi:hypothetical protein